ncbi:MAG: hypothetical protein RIS80_668, partial [Actinomycetota bacterium]
PTRMSRQFEFVTRTSHGNEVREFPNLVYVPPGENLGDGVCAGNKEEFGIWVENLNVAKRVDCVGQSIAIYVNTTYPKSWTRNRGFAAVAITDIK